MKRILITGAAGQIGTELAMRLRDRYRPGVTLSTDIRDPAAWASIGPAERLDCMDLDALRAVVLRFGATDIFHLAAILSAAAEENPLGAYKINMNGLVNVLQVATEFGCRVFTPSSIAAFGPGTPRDPAPQSTLQRPTTMYGVTKVAGELLCDYYHARFGVDARGLRFPGLVSYTAPPGGGTTDYAVDIFHAALDRGALHLLPEAGYAHGHDVHARRDPRDHRADGGPVRVAGAPQRLQRHGHALHPGRAGGRDPGPRARFPDRLRPRPRAPGDRRLLARAPRRFRGPRAVGAGATNTSFRTWWQTCSGD